jgi:hypothetical protein
MFQIPIISNTNMTNMQICEVEAPVIAGSFKYIMILLKYISRIVRQIVRWPTLLICIHIYIYIYIYTKICRDAQEAYMEFCIKTYHQYIYIKY